MFEISLNFEVIRDDELIGDEEIAHSSSSEDSNNRRVTRSLRSAHHDLTSEDRASKGIIQCHQYFIIACSFFSPYSDVADGNAFEQSSVGFGFMLNV
ncbi:hypothetical protein Y032_0661g1281 [Ancylostoma ceylanicum]|nr:hypothetical protein Y032_0661g1281 [Ancylostoma ceylanicum]